MVVSNAKKFPLALNFNAVGIGSWQFVEQNRLFPGYKEGYYSVASTINPALKASKIYSVVLVICSGYLLRKQSMTQRQNFNARAEQKGRIYGTRKGCGDLSGSGQCLTDFPSGFKLIVMLQRQKWNAVRWKMAWFLFKAHEGM